MGWDNWLAFQLQNTCNSFANDQWLPKKSVVVDLNKVFSYSVVQDLVKVKMIAFKG